MQFTHTREHTRAHSRTHTYAHIRTHTRSHTPTHEHTNILSVVSLPLPLLELTMHHRASGVTGARDGFTFDLALTEGREVEHQELAGSPGVPGGSVTVRYSCLVSADRPGLCSVSERKQEVYCGVLGFAHHAIPARPTSYMLAPLKAPPKAPPGWALLFGLVLAWTRDARQRCSLGMPVRDARQRCSSEMLVRDARQRCSSEMLYRDAR